MILFFEPTRGRSRSILATALVLGLAVLARAAEAPLPESPTAVPPPPNPAPPPASGAYGEKLDLVTDASVAESLARQKTLSFSSVRIDGEESDVSLSALTAEQILNAVATKVPTPDLDADAVGGLLQLTSRRAFDQKQRTLRGNLAVTYDSLIGQPMPDASITYGRSLGARQRSGFLATLEYRQGRDRNESVELDWDVNTGQLDRFQVGEEEERGTEMNFNGAFDWKLGEKSVAFFRTETQFSTERDDGRSLEYDLPASPVALPASGAEVSGVTLKHLFEEGRRRQNSVSLAAGASHQGDTWLMDLRSTYRASRDRRLEDHNYDFEEKNVTVFYRRTEASFPTATGTGDAMPGDPTRQLLGELRVRAGTERESDAVASFDITRLWRDQVKSGWLKSGVKARLRRTTEDDRNDVYNATGAGVRGSELARATTQDVLAGRYTLAGFPDFDALHRLFDTQPERFARDEDKSRSDTDPANFDVREHVYAGYAMASFPLGANRIVAGLRAEHTASRFSGYEVAFDEGGRYAGTTRAAARRSHTDLFPGVHASRALTKNLTAFASWTRSISRPGYTDLVPARRISRADREIEEGNADLRSTLYTNYDVAFDYDYHVHARASLELFYRDIRDPILTRRTILSDGQFFGYERTRPENGGRASLQGLELTWDQELVALSRRLEGIEFKVHYTHQDSRQVVESRPGESLPLTQRPRHEVTVQLAYDRDGYYASLEFEHRGRTLDSIGRRSNEDRSELAANHWNISLSREFRKGLRVFLDLENLTATPDRSFAGDPSRPDRYSLDLREYRLGMKWEK